MKHDFRPLAVTMGEPAGIGGELTLQAYAFRKEHDLPPFVVFDDPERLAALAAHLDMNIRLATVTSEEQALAVFNSKLPVFPIPLKTPVTPGVPDFANAKPVQDSIRHAVNWVKAGDCSALVTNPISKAVMHHAGFQHVGHTEFLAELAHTKILPVMMMITDHLRVVPLTIHMPLKDVPTAITVEKIVATGVVILRELKAKFGIENPRLAVSGLNPHAGEGGVLGDEEEKIIQPAIEQLRQMDCGTITGAHAADTLFHEEAREQYDCALCMYHDQALIPLKTLGLWQGVNVTLGLPFIRTSPDHGTAFDIAGKNMAKPDSFIAAMLMAERLAATGR